MASLEAYEDDGYSEEEEEDEWEEPIQSCEVISWCKDHQQKNSELSELVSVADFQSQCKELQAVADGSYGQQTSNLSPLSKSLELGISQSDLSKLLDACK